MKKRQDHVEYCRIVYNKMLFWGKFWLKIKQNSKKLNANLTEYFLFKTSSQELDHHAEGQWLIHGTNHLK